MEKLPTPLVFARDLEEYLSHVRPTEKAIGRAKEFVRARRGSRHELLDRKGHEYVVEAFLRPKITRYAAGKLHIPQRDWHRRVYSSHFHTTSDLEADWRTKWTEFRRAHPDVDTHADGHSCRADLFIAMGKGLVSIEFKYLRANSKPAVQACVRQIRQHLTRHRACVLVLYTASPQSAKLASAAEAIRADLRRAHGFVVVMAGPAIEFP